MSGAWPLMLRGVFVCSWNIPQWFREAHPHPGKPEHIGPLLRIIDALRTRQAVECLGPVFSSRPAHWDSSSSFQFLRSTQLGCPIKMFPDSRRKYGNPAMQETQTARLSVRPDWRRALETSRSPAPGHRRSLTISRVPTLRQHGAGSLG